MCWISSFKHILIQGMALTWGVRFTAPGTSALMMGQDGGAVMRLVVRAFIRTQCDSRNQTRLVNYAVADCICKRGISAA